MAISFRAARTSPSHTGKHAFKAGAEVRLNRDTTYFGVSPNGEYDFGGGTAYATEAIPSQSGKHDIDPGDPLPDTLSGFLSGSPFDYRSPSRRRHFQRSAHWSRSHQPQKCSAYVRTRGRLPRLHT